VTDVSEVLIASVIRAVMEAVSTSETSVNFYQTTLHNILEDIHLHSRRENPKSHLVSLTVFSNFLSTHSVLLLRTSRCFTPPFSRSLSHFPFHAPFSPSFPRTACSHPLPSPPPSAFCAADTVCRTRQAAVLSSGSVGVRRIYTAVSHLAAQFTTRCDRSLIPGYNLMK
jgi:hypothetical protein